MSAPTDPPQPAERQPSEGGPLSEAQRPRGSEAPLGAAEHPAQPPSRGARASEVWKATGASESTPGVLEASIEPPHRPRARALVTLLGDESPEVWEVAREALLELGRAAVPALESAARLGEPRARVRSRSLLRTLDQRRAARALLRVLGRRQLDFEAGLWRMAAFEQPGADLQPARRRLEELCERVRERLREAPAGYERAMVLPSVLGGEVGLGGELETYHHPRNTSIAHALNSGQGLPLTLVGIYQAVARRVGLNAYGVGLPGHMLLRVPFGERSVLIDPYHFGAVRTRKGVTAMLLGQGHSPNPRWFASDAPNSLLARQLANLDLAFAASGRGSDRHELRPVVRAAVRHGLLRPQNSPPRS